MYKILVFGIERVGYSQWKREIIDAIIVSSISNRNVNIIAEVIKCTGKMHINIGSHITNINIFFILISI